MKAEDLVSVKPIAVKQIDLGTSSSSDLTSVYREVKTLQELNHKHIVECVGHNSDAGILYIYTPLKAGNVNDMLEQYPETRFDNVQLQLAQQMLEALDYLAWKGLCHRDVKPDNILYTRKSDDKYMFQLADFGFANRKDLAHTYCGSPMFMAPEMYYHSHPQTPKLDVWSLCVTIVSIRYPAEFNVTRFGQYEEILAEIRNTVTKNPALGPMARKDPALRASAAQMLVQIFGGSGLTTPRGRIGPMPVPGDDPSPLQVPGPSLPQPKARVTVVANPKRGRLASPGRSTCHGGKAHSGRPKDGVRRDGRRVHGTFQWFT
ncbi:kinase-like protein [Byssothecium circinans]|uniref:non-specific serine/threonine protein kinase n=1 Tax=Byssothecium circinans TaxID=147558 RepID=A0A6A5T907_9PLEO|nr:kinase-like protein [Byssothecium circinans]